MPNRGDVLKRIPELRELAGAAGRGHIPVTFFPQATAAGIEKAAEAGVERCIFYVPPDGRDPALTRVAELAELTRPYAE
jgi:hypothetical protein